MAFFEFDAAHLLGRVREVDTRKVAIIVNRDEDLRKAHVGQLLALTLSGGVDAWLIGIIDKVTKSVCVQDAEMDDTDETAVLEQEVVVNTVRTTLVGTAKWDAVKGKNVFSRSLNQVPEIDASCYVLKDQLLEKFMNLLTAEAGEEHSLEIGKYTIDESAKAFLDGNKLFQRHAALLGSTGSGKSWTVASILERAAKLKS